MQVIPVINCHFGDDECVKSKLAAMHFLKGADWAHLDVADGRFAVNRTWASPGQWKNFGGGVKLEVHLMVEEPAERAKEWANAGANRIIIHAETVDRKTLADIVHAVRASDASVALALSPETDVWEAEGLLNLVMEYQVLGVHPGLSGQKFLPLASSKIYELKAMRPHTWVEVDGGVNPDVARMVKKMGADAVASGSYIFGSSDPARAYAELIKI